MSLFELDSKIVIVGSGILGLYTAVELVTSHQIPGEDIAIISEGTASSGRLATHQNLMGSLCELGAGRFNVKLHPRVHSLLRKCGINLERFIYKITYPRVDTNNLKEIIRDISNANYRKNDVSFSSFVEKRYGSSIVSSLSSFSGYRAIHNENISVQDALKVLKSHPESLFNEDLQEDWYAPINGFSYLIFTLFNFLKEFKVSFYDYSRIIRARKDKKNVFLDCLKSEVELFSIKTETCFFCIPVSKFSLIQHPWFEIKSHISHVVDVPLFKCFLFYNHSWWRDYKINKNCFLTSCDLQKIYFNDEKKIIFFYCDSGSALRMNQVWSQNKFEFRVLILKKISEATELPLEKLGEEVSIVAKFWSSGVSFWSKNKPHQDEEFFVPLEPNSYLCSDIFTNKNGWMEGSLMSGEKACEHFKVFSHSDIEATC